MTDATIDELIEAHRLEPHPEGGFYRRVFEHPDRREGRPLASAIVYLLPSGVRSRWHRLDAVELWHAGSGAPLELSTSPDGRTVDQVVLGPARGQVITAAVAAGSWQSARTVGEWSLVTVTVLPGFMWEGFEVAPDGWEPGAP